MHWGHSLSESGLSSVLCMMLSSSQTKNNCRVVKFELQLKALLSILALSLSETHNVFYGYSRQPIKVSQRHQQPATEHHHRKSKTTTEQECSRAATANNMRMIPPRWTPNNTSAAPLDTANFNASPLDTATMPPCWTLQSNRVRTFWDFPKLPATSHT